MKYLGSYNVVTPKQAASIIYNNYRTSLQNKNFDLSDTFELTLKLRKKENNKYYYYRCKMVKLVEHYKSTRNGKELLFDFRTSIKKITGIDA